MQRLLWAAAALWIGQAVIATADEPASVERPRCEYRVDPLGVDAARPRLSWEMCDARRGARQTAYQVLVASSPERLAAGVGDLWDSGRVASDQSVNVPYSGKPLASRAACFWKVRVWDAHEKPSAWSEPARWTTGLLQPSDWRAKWILATTENKSSTPLPIFRRAFDVTKPVRRAEVYACGLGFHEVRLNGEKLGDAVLEPGWTNYRRSCRYCVYDVTRLLAPGRNAIGVLLGNGMYNVVGGRYTKFTGSFGPPKLILQLHIDYADGESVVVASDKSWRWAAGPIRFSCIYGGEDYDARSETPGWDTAAFDDSPWKSASETTGPGGKLVAESAPPVKPMQEFTPANVTRPKRGVFVYDFGQNHSGVPQLTVEGCPGATVKLIPGELLEPDGTVRQQQSGKPAWFAYTLKGRGPETWRPRFSYYGYRYVQVEGGTPPGARVSTCVPRILDLRSFFVHNSADVVGRFVCSQPDVNRIHDIINAAMRSNMQSLLTDCPHREKLGWLEQTHQLAYGLMFNFELPTLYAKICDDMGESQTADGLVPDIAPEYTVFEDGFRDSSEWGSACVIAPWRVYEMYGDAEPLTKHYEEMKRYVAYLDGKAKNHILSHGLGDWADYGPKPPGYSQLTSIGLTATAVYYQDIVLLREMALLLKKPDDAARYAKQADEVRAAFNRAFFHADANRYDRNSQTANAMPLALGLTPGPRRAAVLENLVKNLRGNGDRVSAGDIGFLHVVHALCDGRRGDVLYDMVCQDSGPGYLWQLKMGHTTMTETWDCNPDCSQNHCMLGHAEEWFYRGLGGINPDPTAPGFKRFVVAPQVVGDLVWADVAYRSLYGEIVSRWRRDREMLTLDVAVPPNTRATIHVPAHDADSVTEGGKPAAQAEGVTFLRAKRGEAVYEVGSGRYHFSSRLPY